MISFDISIDIYPFSCYYINRKEVVQKDKDFKLKIVELVIQAVIALAALITAIKS